MPYDRLNRTGFVGGPIAREDGVHGTTKQVLTRAAGARCADGAGARARLPVAVGGDSIGRRETWLLGRGAAALGAAARTRRRAAARADDGRTPAVESAGARGGGAETRERDPAKGLG